jgi:hypothetical protein
MRPKLERPVQMFDLTVLDGKPKPRPQSCGGAIVPVTKDTWQAYARRYDVDFKLPDSLPEAGTFDARVQCSNDVLETVGVGGTVIQIATCARCAGIEESVRAMLAEVAARAQGGGQ